MGRALGTFLHCKINGRFYFLSDVTSNIITSNRGSKRGPRDSPWKLKKGGSWLMEMIKVQIQENSQFMKFRTCSLRSTKTITEQVSKMVHRQPTNLLDPPPAPHKQKTYIQSDLQCFVTDKVFMFHCSKLSSADLSTPQIPYCIITTIPSYPQAKFVSILFWCS